MFGHDSGRLIQPRAKTTRRCVRFVLRRLMIDKATVAAVARELGLAWDTVIGLALEATSTIIADGPSPTAAVSVAVEGGDAVAGGLQV